MYKYFIGIASTIDSVIENESEIQISEPYKAVTILISHLYYYKYATIQWG